MASNVTISHSIDGGEVAAIGRGVSSTVGDRIWRGGAPLLWKLVFPTVVLSVWFAGTHWGWLPEQILPKPGDVAGTLVEMLRSGELKTHTGISLLRVIYGFVAGATAGFALGDALGRGSWL